MDRMCPFKQEILNALVLQILPRSKDSICAIKDAPVTMKAAVLHMITAYKVDKKNK